jgi:hypothetical protein
MRSVEYNGMPTGRRLRPSTRWPVILALLTPLLSAGCDPNQPSEASRLWALSSDPTPVEVRMIQTLRDPRTDKYHYKPLFTLKMPKSYFFYYENQQGGPQSVIGVLLNRNTLQPQSETIKKNEDVNRIRGLSYYLTLNKYKNSSFTFQIESTEIRPDFVKTRYNDYVKYVEPGNYMCNATWFTGPSKSSYFPNLEIGSRRGYSLDGIPAEIYCDSHARLCLIGSYYRGALLKIAINKTEVCKWKDAHRKTILFLNGHIENSGEQ